MKPSEPRAETKMIVCANMLGVTNLPLTEAKYYHHAQENPAMRCTSLFILNETPYGISVGCYNVNIARNIMSKISTDPPILSDSNRQKLRLLLEKVIRIDFVGYGRFLRADSTSFRDVQPPEGYCVRRLSSDELADVPVNKNFPTYGIIIDGEVVSRASIVDFTDTAYPISDIVSVYTVPKYRRRGFAKAVVSACTADAIARGRIPTYSAEVENVASLRTCMAIGYHPYGESLEILGHLI